MTNIHDLAFVKFHEVPMTFYPKAWNDFGDDHKYIWEEVEFPPVPLKKIPKSPGVYVFVVGPSIFNFRYANGLFYVGKATSLYSRISSYISELGSDFKKSTRPRVWNMINTWNGYLRYFYTITDSVEEAEKLESQMLQALIPPFNDRIDGYIGKIEKAFP